MTCEMPMLIYYVFKRINSGIITFVRLIYTCVICFFWGVDKGSHVMFAGPIFIRTRKRGSIRIGKGVRINSTKSENPLCANMSVLDTRPGGVIVIGDNSGLSSAVLSARTLIEIGEDVRIGGNVQIYDHNFHALNFQERKDPRFLHKIRTSPVHIGNDCFIGANSILLKGTTLGPRTIVAAGSVVFGLNVPADSIVRGNPAEIVGHAKE